jgi:hypothetical protein
MVGVRRGPASGGGLRNAESQKTQTRAQRAPKKPKKKRRKESQRKQKTEEKKTKNRRENRSQPQAAQIDPVQRMGWAQTDPVEKGRAGYGGYRQEIEPDPALDLTQRTETVARGAVGEESRKGEPSRG